MFIVLVDKIVKIWDILEEGFGKVYIIFFFFDVGGIEDM